MCGTKNFPGGKVANSKISKYVWIEPKNTYINSLA